MTYNFTEIAKYFNVNKSTVTRWVQNGELNVITVDGKKLVTEEAVEIFKRQFPKYDNSISKVIRLEHLEQMRAELMRQLKDVNDEIKKIEKTL